MKNCRSSNFVGIRCKRREADNNRSKPSHFPRQKKDDERPTYSIYKKMA
uniref:Uncharacterized protein n=1 Tax=Meloidogyne enterolobii TaxID=390850 RepID=A0A6V7X3V9_MELEN|nr:unnamed protein product [Meloidogyne enterolobii]